MNYVLPVFFLALMGLTLWSTYDVSDTVAEERPLLRLAFAFATVTVFALLLWVGCQLAERPVHPWDLSATAGVAMTYLFRTLAAPAWGGGGVDITDPSPMWMLQERPRKLNLAKIAYAMDVVSGLLALVWRLR